MNINELIEKENPTVEESIFVQNFMIDAMVKQLEHQRETIKTHEATIQSLVEFNSEYRDAITQIQLAYQDLCRQFDVVKQASVELGGGYQASETGIVFR